MKKVIRGLILTSLLVIGMGKLSTEAYAAGEAKPLNVQTEVTYEVLEVKGSQGSGGTVESCGLFDGTQVNEWKTERVMFWNDISNYIEIDIQEDCNIWRSGTDGWLGHNGSLGIYKWDGTAYQDITASITQTVSRINQKEWEKTISNLSAGRYKFAFKDGFRLDSEWYLESVNESDKKELKVVLEPDEELQLSVSDDLSENVKLIWSSSNTKVAIVNETGLVKAIAKGEAVITVNNADGSYQDSIKILVVENAEDYRLAVDLTIGKTCRVTIDDYTFTKKITWSTMDNSVASINEKGKITASNKGLTIVTATDESGNVIGQVYIRVR